MEKPPTLTQRPPRRKRRIWRSVLIILVALVVIVCISTAVYLRPYAASNEALAALHSSQMVTVSENDTVIAFLPRTTAHVGLIFYPGAKVVPAAYAITMHLLADHGYATFIVKVPLNIALLGENSAAPVIAAYPQITSWAVGGHSLGGVAASNFAGSHPIIKGLLLYASYPNGSLAQHTHLHVVSISATHDGLATPDKIEAAKSLLPATTTYHVIEGGIHGYFGDYGPQDGDGQATITREQAREQIVAASLQFLNDLTATS
jgi:preprotein translocase subunit SecG